MVLLLGFIAGLICLTTFDRERHRKLRADCAVVENQLAQCETARRAIHKELRRKAVLTKDVERLRREVTALEK